MYFVSGIANLLAPSGQYQQNFKLQNSSPMSRANFCNCDKTRNRAV